MKRLLQLLLTGEPEPLAQPEYRYYMGIDLGIREPSVAIVGHVQGKVFQVDHVRQWDDWHFDSSAAEVQSILDAYSVKRGWVDHFNSQALVNHFDCLTMMRGVRGNIEGAQRVAHYVVKNGLLARTWAPIPGKPSDYSTVITESVRCILDGETSDKDADADQYIMALVLALWGTASFESDWIGSSTVAAIQTQR